jgi:hypothetical protein
MEIEDKLRSCWEDRRLFEIWSEYYTATQIQKINPNWGIKVSPNIRDDVVCCIGSGQEKKEIRIQVKTGKWQTWNWGTYKLNSADAIFSRFQIEKASFHYAVFFVHENYERIKWIFIFSREDLNELRQHKRIGNRASPYFVSKVESLEAYKKWQGQYDPPESIYTVEELLIEKPEKFLDRWDRIV